MLHHTKVLPSDPMCVTIQYLLAVPLMKDRTTVMSSGVTRSSIMPTTKVASSVSSFTLRESLVMIMVNSRREGKNRSNQIKNVHNYFAELIACFAKTHRETLKVSEFLLHYQNGEICIIIILLQLSTKGILWED